MGTDAWPEQDKRGQDRNMSGGGRDMAGQDRRQAATPVGDRLGRGEPWMLFGGGGGGRKLGRRPG